MPGNDSRTWLFTINNPTAADDPKKWNNVKYCIYQLEKGENGTLHYQGFVSFNSHIRLQTLKNKYNSKAHWETRKGTVDQAIAYCSKEETRQEGPFEIGKRPEQGKRNDLLLLKEDLDKNKSIIEISDEHFGQYLRYNKGIISYRRLHQVKRNDKTFVGVIVGPTGVGKSRLMQQKFPNAFWKTCGDKWWDDYDHEDIVIIDEYYGWLPYAYLLRLLDRYPMQVEYKGGMLNFAPKQIWICANTDPMDWYKWTEKMKFDPLERRIDFYATMLPNGTFRIQKGNNPFDKFEQIDLTCNENMADIEAQIDEHDRVYDIGELTDSDAYNASDSDICDSPPRKRRKLTRTNAMFIHEISDDDSFSQSDDSLSIKE